MSKLDVVFSHGQESGPWGSKITAMAEAARGIGCGADSVDYQGIADPHERVDKLLAHMQSLNPDRLVLVGSSMGGHVATAAALIRPPRGVFALAPAYFMPGFESLTPLPPSCPLAIVHGWRDTVVPVENAIRFATDARAELHVIDGDHRLTANIDQINELFLAFLRRRIENP